MAKMAYPIGLFFQCSYLQFLSMEFVRQFEEPQHLVVFIDENENETSLKSVEGDNIHDFATLPVYTKSQSVYDTMVKVSLDEQNIEYDHMIHVVIKKVQELVNNLEDSVNRTVKIQDEHLHAEDQNS